MTLISFPAEDLKIILEIQIPRASAKDSVGKLGEAKSVNDIIGLFNDLNCGRELAHFMGAKDVSILSYRKKCVIQ